MKEKKKRSVRVPEKRKLERRDTEKGREKRRELANRGYYGPSPTPLGSGSWIGSGGTRSSDSKGLVVVTTVKMGVVVFMIVMAVEVLDTRGRQCGVCGSSGECVGGAKQIDGEESMLGGTKGFRWVLGRGEGGSRRSHSVGGWS